MDVAAQGTQPAHSKNDAFAKLEQTNTWGDNFIVIIIIIIIYVSDIKTIEPVFSLFWGFMF